MLQNATYFNTSALQKILKMQIKYEDRGMDAQIWGLMKAKGA